MKERKIGKKEKEEESKAHFLVSIVNQSLFRIERTCREVQQTFDECKNKFYEWANFTSRYKIYPSKKRTSY